MTGILWQDVWPFVRDGYLTDTEIIYAGGYFFLGMLIVGVLGLAWAVRKI